MNTGENRGRSTRQESDVKSNPSARVKTRRTGSEIAAVVLGIFLMAAGAFSIILPGELVVFHQADEGGGYIEHVSKSGSRMYGVIAVIIGSALVWLANRPAKGRKGRAIERYVWQLPQELSRRFGAKKYYTIEEVSRTAKGGGHNMAFIAYAHAMLCTRNDFDEYYTPLRVACTYDGLRALVSRRYFGGVRDFDAATLIRVSKEPYPEENNFYQGVDG
jgi:hypothetical protein